MRRLARALPLVVLAVLLLPLALADVTGPLVAEVQGPQGLAPAQRAFYNVTISGGPTGQVNYSVRYYVTGANVSGASPTIGSPATVTGTGLRYQINVTSPGVEEDLTLVVTVTASQIPNIQENTTVSYPITVKTPIVLSATFHNSSTTAAVNVTVRWYVDGTFVGTSTIKQIAANGDATVTFDYVPIGLSAGEHTVTAEADLDHDGTINPSRGEVATSTIFYNQAAPLSSGWVILIGIAVFIPVFLGVVAFRRRGQT